MKNKYRFYIIGTGNDYIKYMWKDVLTEENVFFLEKPIDDVFPHKKVYDYVEQKQYSYKLNLYLSIPGKKIWRKYYTIRNVEFDSAYKNIVVFSDVMRVQTDVAFWMNLKRKHNLIYCLILLNSCEHDFNASSGTVKKIIQSLHMDMIFSFDSRDAQRYQLHYFPSLYSGVMLPKTDRKYDFYFVGKKKNRYKSILDTYFELKNNGYRCLFRITDVNDCEMIKDDGIIYNQNISYDKVIEEISKSYGIVDVKIPEQSGLSLRYFEAVQYNKALLTNNASVKDMPYYRSDYMYCFKTVDKIPTLVQDTNRSINYGYDGRYSPRSLISRIKKCVEDSLL